MDEINKSIIQDYKNALPFAIGIVICIIIVCYAFVWVDDKLFKVHPQPTIEQTQKGIAIDIYEKTVETSDGCKVLCLVTPSGWGDGISCDWEHKNCTS